MWVEPKPIGIYNHSRRRNIFSSDEKNYLRGPKMSFMHTICVVCCWRSNFCLVIVTPLAVKINAPGTPSCFKRGRYPACYNQPLLQPAPVSPTYIWVYFSCFSFSSASVYFHLFHPHNHHLSPNSPRLMFLFVKCATVNKVLSYLIYLFHREFSV